MAARYKLTGCAKFLIFFIIAAPLAYIGASYYNGVNPFDQVQGIYTSVFGGENTSAESTNEVEHSGSESNDAESVYQEMELKELEIKHLKADLDECNDLRDKQNSIIETQKKEIQQLRSNSTNE